MNNVIFFGLACVLAALIFYFDLSLSLGGAIFAIWAMTILLFVLRKQSISLWASNAKLRENENRFRSFAAATSDRFWESDEDHKFNYVNDPRDAESMPSRSEILGKTRWELLGVELDKDPVWSQHVAGMDAHEPFKDFVFMANKQGRNEVFLSVSGVPIFHENGLFKGYRGTATDVTKRVELRRMKDEFISTASHELRTPLTAIHGSLKLIIGGALGEVPDPAMEMIELANKNSERLIALVNDILDMEKIEAGSMAFHLETVDMGAVVSTGIHQFSGYADEFDVKVEHENIEQDLFVIGDAERLHQVLINLLSNATKFSPTGSSIDVSVIRYDNKVRVSVKDNGPGVPESFKNHIFDKFSQSDASDTRQVGGTGLGLSISKAIIEKHTGVLDFESVPGQGATFYFELPLKK